MVFSNIAELKSEKNVHVAFAAHTGKEVTKLDRLSRDAHFLLGWRRLVLISFVPICRTRTG
jgi:hypothetical protein